MEKFPGLLADGDIAMLSRLFSLLARVPPTAEGGEGGEGGVERRHSTTISSSSSSNDLSGMVTAFREYLIGRGAKELKALEFSSCSRAAGAAAAAVPGTQPPPPRNLLLSSLVADSEAYIEQLLRLFNDATKLIKDAFGGDPRFLTARDMVSGMEKCVCFPSLILICFFRPSTSSSMKSAAPTSAAAAAPQERQRWRRRWTSVRTITTTTTTT